MSWHQDATYFALDPICHVTAWVALTDAPVELGCMEVVPGSHRLGQLCHADMQDTDNMLSRGQTLAAEVDRSRTAYMAVKAGQFSLHHTHLVHNSRPNRSTHRRVGLGISYIPTHARCTRRIASGDAGARRGQLWPFRRGASAEGRCRSGGAASFTQPPSPPSGYECEGGAIARSSGRAPEVHTIRLPYHDRYPYSPITARKDYSWPGGKRLAVYLGLNIEHFAFGAGEGHCSPCQSAARSADLRVARLRQPGRRVALPGLFDELNLPARI